MKEVTKQKQEIRETALAARKKLTREHVLTRSKTVIENLKKLEEYKSAGKIMCYVSFDAEVNTKEFIKNELADKKTIIVPFIKDEKIFPSKLSAFDNLVKGKYNTLEPKDKVLFVGDIDLIIIPGVAFDINGSRIGFGKGYFDEFLKGYRESFKVGLAFEEQIVDFIPTTRNDVQMDVIVTDKRIIDNVCLSCMR
ncbi:MAG: 5-formyltetrahydrofolate cyclo-ligase [Nanoarchaeota archaeon]|nr:5-formyltetrahydrofolate cyclo-ligase [Nanoarchaeota archaeon]MBU1269987.1 5-formyltetrahydrofolate cyclo-ligase [Nanoarchaeota archaeon]MBU1604409.1 5-formyltetrahydrofolate cyclo-ligase [Nanoarchaeota archaeon]MBU2442585.1 5-formyltetrahydrofolate cyclo-ligase [Nanoarchaeota archaeon]